MTIDEICIYCQREFDIGRTLRGDTTMLNRYIPII